MNKNEKVQTSQGMSQGQLFEFVGALLKAIPSSLTKDIAQGWIENPSGLKKLMQGLVPPTSSSLALSGNIQAQIDVARSILNSEKYKKPSLKTHVIGPQELAGLGFESSPKKLPRFRLFLKITMWACHKYFCI